MLIKPFNAKVLSVKSKLESVRHAFEVPPSIARRGIGELPGRSDGLRVLGGSTGTPVKKRWPTKENSGALFPGGAALLKRSVVLLGLVERCVEPFDGDARLRFEDSFAFRSSLDHRRDRATFPGHQTFL